MNGQKNIKQRNSDTGFGYLLLECVGFVIGAAIVGVAIYAMIISLNGIVDISFPSTDKKPAVSCSNNVCQVKE